MSTPWVPPYFGSWEQLYQSLLHNPFLGSGSEGRHHPLPRMMAEMSQSHQAPPSFGPSPDPWRSIVTFLISQVSLKELASTLPREQANELIARVDRTISEAEDDICGNGIRPWPWPGPPPWVSVIAAELNAIANTFQEGTLRSELTKVAGQILQKGLAAGSAASVGAAKRPEKKIAA